MLTAVSNNPFQHSLRDDLVFLEKNIFVNNAYLRFLSHYITPHPQDL